MKRFFIYIAAFAAGISLSLEAAIAGMLGENIGEIESSYFIFMLGTVILGLTTLFFGKGKLSYAFQAPKWTLLGGSLGVLYLTILVFSTPFIGVSISIVAVIIGQLVMSVIIEHFGWLKSKQVLINKERVCAIICMGIALIFIF